MRNFISDVVLINSNIVGFVIAHAQEFCIANWKKHRGFSSSMVPKYGIEFKITLANAIFRMHTEKSP